MRTPAGLAGLDAFHPTALHMYTEASGTTMLEYIGFKTLMQPGNIFFTENLSYKCQQIKRFKTEQMAHPHFKTYSEHTFPLDMYLFINPIYIVLLTY